MRAALRSALPALALALAAPLPGAAQFDFDPALLTEVVPGATRFGERVGRAPGLRGLRRRSRDGRRDPGRLRLRDRRHPPRGAGLHRADHRPRRDGSLRDRYGDRDPRLPRVAHREPRRLPEPGKLPPAVPRKARHRSVPGTGRHRRDLGRHAHRGRDGPRDQKRSPARRRLLPQRRARGGGAEVHRNDPARRTRGAALGRDRKPRVRRPGERPRRADPGGPLPPLRRRPRGRGDDGGTRQLPDRDRLARDARGEPPHAARAERPGPLLLPALRTHVSARTGRSSPSRTPTSRCSPSSARGTSRARSGARASSGSTDRSTSPSRSTSPWTWGRAARPGPAPTW